MAPGTPIPADCFYDKPLPQPHLRALKMKPRSPKRRGFAA